MPIRKQEFYEGAALYLLARSGEITSIEYQHPFFLINGCLLVLIKYCTRNRSPWGFTITPDEQEALKERENSSPDIVFGLVCGSDGIAAVPYSALKTVAALQGSAIHVACYRKLGEHYEFTGPDGAFDKKIAPSSWPRILEEKRRTNEAFRPSTGALAEANWP